MKPRPFTIVPAGKRAPVRRSVNYKYVFPNINSWIQAKKVRRTHFLLAVLLVLLSTLTLYDYMSNYVYVVMLDDKEVGVVADARELEGFIADLTDRCGSLYGMRMESGGKIDLVREFRPGSEPQAESVQAAIRQQMTLFTEAYMIKVDGEPLLAVHSKSDLDEVVELLKEAYHKDDNNVKLLDSFIIEELSLEPYIVNPEDVFIPEEVVAMVVEGSNKNTYRAAVTANISERTFLDSRQSYSNVNPISVVHSVSEEKRSDNTTAFDSNGIHVKTVEEVLVVEEIPFATEYIYDEEMWTVEKEIDIPGQEGKKEIVYHITRENGVEVDRARINEKVIAEPVTQIEIHGTARVPNIGSGQFIWPVEGGGEITPGRGFSAWHTGIDIAADAGTNILASDSGVVWFSGRGGSQGNYIIIYHGSYWSLYLHNEANLVSEGDRVEQGDVIGRVGSTGRSSGPHLHFEIRLDDGTGEWHGYYQHKPIDPLRFFNP